MSREIGLMFQDWGIRAMMLPPGTPGRKTQTRRIMRSRWFEIKDNPVRGGYSYSEYDPPRSHGLTSTECEDGRYLAGGGPFDPANPADQRFAVMFSPFQPGDTMYVKEAWANPYDNEIVYYKADNERTHTDEGVQIKWRSSMFMPKKYARLRFPITGVRVQRLQEITEEDARAEGVEQSTWQYSCQPYRNYHLKEGWLPGQGCSTAVSSFVSLWESINGPVSWASNPWVWVYEWE